MTTETKWTYRGHEITFNPTHAAFCATISGKTTSAPSLDAIKKKIDAANAFEPFDALVEASSWRDQERIKKGELVLVATVAYQFKRFGDVEDRAYNLLADRVTGFDRRSKQFICEHTGTNGSVITNTPENIEAWKAWRQACVAEELSERQHQAATYKAHAAVVYQRASEYAAGK